MICLSSKKLLLRLICTSVTYTIIRNKWDSFNAFTILVIITSNIYINFLWNLNQRKLPSKTFSGIICILYLFVYTVRNKDTATIFITLIIHISTWLNTSIFLLVPFFYHTSQRTENVKVWPVWCNVTKPLILDMCTLSEHEHGFPPFQQHCMFKRTNHMLLCVFGSPFNVYENILLIFLLAKVNKIPNCIYLVTISQLVKS